MHTFHDETHLFSFTAWVTVLINNNLINKFSHLYVTTTVTQASNLFFIEQFYCRTC